MSRSPLPNPNSSSRASLLLISHQELEASSANEASFVCKIAGFLGGGCYDGTRKKASESSGQRVLGPQSASNEIFSTDNHGRSIEAEDGAGTSGRPSESPAVMEEEDGSDNEEDDSQGMSKAKILYRMKLELERRKFLENERRERRRTLLKPASYLSNVNLRNGHDTRSSRSSLSTYETLVIMNSATAALNVKAGATIALNNTDQAIGYIENDFDRLSTISEEGGSLPGAQTTAMFSHIPSRPLPRVPYRYVRNRLSDRGKMTSFPALSETPLDGDEESSNDESL
ncbi:hypothetical protein BGX27_000405 [Mortierella sp. AM989]|nr:hypothetical protein BGX27_000405 [Mortierella sp. AM989]